MVRLMGPRRLQFAGFLVVAALSRAQSLEHRSVSGTVVDNRGNPLRHAVVQIENTANLQVASYITQDDGRYYFHQLSSDVDYQLIAHYRKYWSKPHMLTRFNTSREPNIDLTIPIE